MKLKTFRRHIVELGKTGFTFIYDELEAEEPVTWSYLLHTVTNPMNVNMVNEFVHVQATSKNGISDAYLLGSDELKTDTTSQFSLLPPIGCAPTTKETSRSIRTIGISLPLQASTKCIVCHYYPYPYQQNHSRQTVLLTATSERRQHQDGKLDHQGQRIFRGQTFVRCTFPKTQYDAAVTYDGDVTVVREDGYETTLRDKLPELEI